MVGEIQMYKKYLRPKDIEEQYGIKQSTLSRQRWGKYGLPFSIVGRNQKNKMAV